MCKATPSILALREFSGPREPLLFFSNRFSHPKNPANPARSCRPLFLGGPHIYFSADILVVEPVQRARDGPRDNAAVDAKNAAVAGTSKEFFLLIPIIGAAEMGAMRIVSGEIFPIGGENPSGGAAFNHNPAIAP